MLICLAISCGLIGLLFLYIRQKIYVFEMRLNTISDIVKELTQELAGPRLHTFQEIENDSDTESESESDSDTDYDKASEDESDQESIHVTLDEVKIEPDVIQLSPPLEIVDDKIEVSDDEEIKMIVIEKSQYDGLSVKELKAKVVELGGPSSLKTKKALLDFLEKK